MFWVLFASMMMALVAAGGIFGSNLDDEDDYIRAVPMPIVNPITDRYELLRQDDDGIEYVAATVVPNNYPPNAPVPSLKFERPSDEQGLYRQCCVQFSEPRQRFCSICMLMDEDE
jgi:hypothetical protein